jgi:pimeloyl-ACP methyl ester carboxylesterase
MDDMEGRRVPVAEGVELAVDAWPPANDAVADAPPFVLVHGLASNARMWDGVAQALVGAGHPVFTVDLRGHGRSSKPGGPYGVRTVASDLVALIEALGLEGVSRPIVAGQSWGGNVVLELAARRPDLVRGIACIDGGWLEPSRDFASWEACREALSPPRLAGRRLQEIEGYIRSAHPDWPETGIRGVLGNFEIRPDGTIAPWLTFERHIEVLRGLWDDHPAERYPGMSIPVLLVPVAGGEDERTQRRRRQVDEASTAIPNARVRWFTGDHDIHAQHPIELAGVLHDLTADGFFA